MLTNIIKLKQPIVNGTNTLNILIHVTILFTILSLFFTHYVRFVAADAINGELSHIIEEVVHKSEGKKDELKNIILKEYFTNDEYVFEKNNLEDMARNITQINSFKELNNNKPINTSNELKYNINNFNINKIIDTANQMKDNYNINNIVDTANQMKDNYNNIVDTANQMKDNYNINNIVDTANKININNIVDTANQMKDNYNINNIVDTANQININKIVDTANQININKIVDTENKININNIVDTANQININKIVDTANQININKIVDTTNQMKDNFIAKQINDNINTVKNKINNNFSYDYYVKLFSKEDDKRAKINNQILFYLKMTNGFIIIMLILFTYYLLKTKNITIEEIKHLLFENILTFIFIGVIEYFFFTRVALKFIPAPPSLIAKSFMTALNDELN